MFYNSLAFGTKLGIGAPKISTGLSTDLVESNLSSFSWTTCNQNLPEAILLFKDFVLVHLTEPFTGPIGSGTDSPNVGKIDFVVADVLATILLLIFIAIVFDFFAAITASVIFLGTFFCTVVIFAAVTPTIFAIILEAFFFLTFIRFALTTIFAIILDALVFVISVLVITGFYGAL